MLADAVNVSQRALTRTKEAMDKRLDRMRQVIHEKTAPKSAAPPPASEASPGPAKSTAARSRPKKTRKARGKASRRAGQA